MHDVPRESVGKHLGFGYGKDDGKPRDELDARLARTWARHFPLEAFSNLITEHARYIYSLQESAEAPSSDSDEESEESDDSSNPNGNWRQTNARRRVNRSSTKRMSLLTNQYFDLSSKENGFYSHCSSLHGMGLGAPPVKNAKRRFFQGGANWEEDVEKVIAGRMNGSERFQPRGLLADNMARGGRPINLHPLDDDDWDDDESMM